jgi:cytoskeleton protein RodZ
MQMNSEVGYGKRLRNAREAAGWSASAVAEKLHLRTDIVLALEQEDRHQELAPAFMRGYIRSYSQLVSENADELVSLFNRHAGGDPELTQLDKIELFQQEKGAVLRWGTITIAVILLLLAAVWVHDYLQTESSEPDAITGTAPEQAQEVVDIDDSSVESTLDQIMAEQAEQYAGSEVDDIEEIVDMVAAEQTEGMAPDSGSGDVTTNAGTEGLVTTVEGAPSRGELQNLRQNEVVSTAPQGSDQLQVSFDGPSWIEAVDANGHRLVYGLFDELDRQLSVRGKAPFRIIVGDTNNVEIKVNGIKHELRVHTRANNSARVLFGDKNQRTD